MNNVAEDPAYADTLKNLSNTLMGVLEKHGDPRITEEDCRFEHSPYAGPVPNPDDWFSGLHNDIAFKPGVEYY